MVQTHSDEPRCPKDRTAPDGVSADLLAVTGSVSMDDAFTALRNYARSSNLRLSDVARELADRALDPVVVLTRSAENRPS